MSSLSDRELGSIVERLDSIKLLLNDIKEENETRDKERHQLQVEYATLDKEFRKYVEYCEKLATKQNTWISLILSVTSIIISIILKYGVK